MSKTIDLQVGKSETLIAGLRQHLSELSDKGIHAATLDGMEKDLDSLRAANEECDRLRAELSQKVRAMNGVLQQVKDSFAANKRIVKVSYPQEDWVKYGVTDKR